MILDYTEFTGLVERFSSELPELLASHRSTRHFAPRVRGLLEFAESRFTLAVVGQMRAGKSSLLNALIGADLAVVGVNETTATVNFFTHGTGDLTRSFRVHWKGRPPEDRDLSELQSWVGQSSLARETRRLEFFADTPFLRTADVVDTPGTRSLVADHQRTIDEFMAQKVDEETRRLGGGADAIIYVIPPVARQSDAGFLEDFSRTTRLPGSPPHNSLAVVHKWETLAGEDPHAEACQKAERIFGSMSDFVSGSFPVSAPLGMAAERYPDSFWVELMNLSLNSTASAWGELLLGEQEFLEDDIPGCPLTASERSHLRMTFPLPWASLKFLLTLSRRESPGSPRDLRHRALALSNLPRLREELETRFFARSRVLKMSKLVRTAWEPCQEADRVLRNHKDDLAQDLDKSERASKLLAARIRSGDDHLAPAAEFIQTASQRTRHEFEEVANRLRRLGHLIAEVKGPQEQMERDLAMLDVAEATGNALPAQTTAMLRSLFGRGGTDLVARLSFFLQRGKTYVSVADLEAVISELRAQLLTARKPSRPAIEHALLRLEEVCSWMEDKRIPAIPLKADAAPAKS